VEAVDEAGHTPLYRALATEQPAIAALLRGADAPPVIDIRVVEQSTGEAIPQVTLTLRLERDDREVVTDAQGRHLLELTSIRPGFIRGTADSPDYVASRFYFQRRSASVRYPDRVELPMERAIAIGGVVQNEEGQPISGATVHASLWGPSISEGLAIYQRVDDAAETDAEGRWTSDGWPSDFSQPRLRLEHEDYVSDEFAARRDPPSLESLKQQRSVMVMERGVPLQGQVLDATGEAVVGAHVTLAPTFYTRNYYPSTRTDEDGRFELPQVRRGPALVTVRAPGLAPDMHEVMVSADLEPLMFHLEPGHRLHGRVVDRWGDPVPGTTVRARHWREASSLPWRGETDEQGRFEWTDAPPDEVQFDISKAGYINRSRYAMQAGDEAHVVELTPVVEVIGVVIDASTDEPIERFTLVPGFGSAQRLDPHWDRMHAVELEGGRFEYTFSFERQDYH
ncbi:MAG: carboxypeptidase-like regulatory domain-containing protein, partial [Pirellulales bacterium]